jgi:hypothetical protein
VTSGAPFVAAQLVGAAVGLGLLAVGFGRPASVETDVVVPHGEGELDPSAA